MEYRVRKGQYKCECTGEMCSEVIQLADIEGEVRSPWMSIEALSEALKVLLSLRGEKIPEVKIPSPIAPITSEIPPQDSRLIPQIPVVDNSVASQSRGAQSATIVQFRKALSKLYKDPPPDKNGNQSGVPGYAVREICATYKNLCDAKAMLKVLVDEYEIQTDVAKFWVGVE